MVVSEPTVQNEGWCFCWASRARDTPKQERQIKLADARRTVSFGVQLEGHADTANRDQRIAEEKQAMTQPLIDEEESGDEPVVCSCGNSLPHDASFCRKCGKKANKFLGDTPEDLKVCEEIEMIAEKLKAKMKKFPKQGKALFSSFGQGVSDRYVAIVQDTTRPRDGKKCRRTEFQKWQAGYLGYWESETAYKDNQEPKGIVYLMKIMKVQHSPSQSNGRGITIKHKQGEAKELVLLHDTESLAKEWAYLSWDLLAKIRSHQSVR